MLRDVTGTDQKLRVKLHVAPAQVTMMSLHDVLFRFAAAFFANRVVIARAASPVLSARPAWWPALLVIGALIWATLFAERDASLTPGESETGLVGGGFPGGTRSQGLFG